MQVALMIPCYIDLFYPEVGVATLELLEKLKVDVVYPFDQTCCAQPMANSGCYEEARATEELFIKNFSAFDHIVTPSGTCTRDASSRSCSHSGTRQPMNFRDTILQNVRNNQPFARELPAIPKFHSDRPVDLKHQFAAALKELSGEVVTEPPADFEE